MKTKLALVLTLALTPAAFAEEMKRMEMKHSMPMDNMQMEQTHTSTQRAKAKGTVRKIKQNGGSVTIAHGAVPKLEWPPMTMDFKATSEPLSGLKEGQRDRV